MRGLLLILLILTACTKEPLLEDLHMAQLSIEGKGPYLVTYGASEYVTETVEDKWSAYLSVRHGDTLRFTVNTALAPATLYMRVEIEDEILYCRSLYVGEKSAGEMMFIAEH